MKHTGYTPGPDMSGCDCGWKTDKDRATKLHSLECAFRTLDARVENARLAEENERLRELLSHLTHEYRQIFKPVEDSPGFIWMMLHKQFLEDVKAALSGREEGK